ncbi:glycosyltransferase involved in cell wall biosynthesis [Flavobacterium sp. CG_9.10]|uniref:glycosyltransferase n=1 Tax=Flavobacterium sp. CG_9.10 TaxID=2787729 RepID=UPI0018CBE783|nr:glycosyltransferase [Flavobacterium sp. CG_9.10]MBG6109886.1 glycosyltransferase involved in cell wall biosynthesis [Flavobacterium sp. CG_9.10]
MEQPEEFGTNKKYNIVILTASHPYKVSGIVAFDLMQCLNQSGCNVKIVTSSRLEKKYENTITITGTLLGIYQRLKNRLKPKVQNEHLFDSNYYMDGIDEKKSTFKAKKILKKISFKPDAFIYLFPQFFLSTSDLHYLNKKTNAPILWYMMDMAPITGGCHYAWDCLGYTKECGHCPGIYSNNSKDKTNLNWLNKFDFIEKSNIIPIAASQWQFDQLKRSSLFINKPHYKIHLPINNDLFKPGNKSEARNQLGLPQDKQLIFFGAVSVKEIRKGYKELIESLIILKNQISEEQIKDIHLIIAGRNNEKMIKDLPFSHTFLGFLNYSNLALAFQAANVFVCPSIEDSGPMMINQSIMCGTPVASFEMGVAIDLVHNGVTGHRAKLRDCNDLASGLKNILEMKTAEKERMSLNCIELSQKILQPNIIAEKFREILSKNTY